MTGDKVIGVTMGHPSGIGPEVVVKTLCARPQKSGGSRFAVFGDSGVLERAAQGSGLLAEYRAIIKSGAAGVVEVSGLKEKDSAPGHPSEAGSLAQVDYIRQSVTWALDGRVSAIATAPISKSGMISGGYNFPGHTELLARLSGVEDFAMMFASPKLKIALATMHVPLAEVPVLLKADLILKRLRLAAKAMQIFYGADKPRIGVSALNPHGGEDGRIGREESLVIEPAIGLARGEGLDATGPYPADTLMRRALMGEFDLIMAMYHDQALIPVKTLGFGKSVNLTLGLPFVRTSPDHGTAFELASKFAADPAGMATAVDAAVKLSARFPGKEAWTA